MVRFGVEEEFMVLDRRRLAPVSLGDSARAAISPPGARASTVDSLVAGAVSTEFLDCQVETSTAPSETLASAAGELSRFRRSFRTFERNNGVIVGGVGTPYGVVGRTAVTPHKRYHAIEQVFRSLARDHLVNGLHVHTEIVDAESRVRALNAVRPWLPVLLALTGNSPFWRTHESGFSSWRSILLRRMPTMWCPPVFQDLDDYQRRVDRLVRLGVAVDRQSIAWAARVSARYNTVEVRVFDAQLTVNDAMFAAALTRALLVDQPATVQLDSEAIDTSMWTAARSGMSAQLIHPLTGEVSPVWKIVPDLTNVVANSLTAHNDHAFVQEQLAVVREYGTGAQRQRAAVEKSGIDGLRTLLEHDGADQVTSPPSHVAVNR